MTLSARNITVGYRGRPAPVLTGVSMELHPGAVTAIIGPNGAGKSTLLRALLGVLPVRDGSVVLDATPLTRIPARDRAARLAYVPQASTVAFAYSLRQVVAMGRFARPHSDEAVAAALDRMGLTDRAADPFGELSAGQRQRGALARALAQLDAPDPRGRVLLADEPLSALDPRHVLETGEILRSLAVSGVAVGLVLHDLSVASRIADEVHVLSDRGATIAHGPCHEILTSEVLERAFGVSFDRVRSPAGLIILPAAASPAGAAPASPI